MDKLASLKSQLLELEEKLLKPETRTSPHELDQLLSDDFLEFGSSGKVWLKQDCVGPEGVGIVQMSISNFDVHLLSENVALATYRVYNEEKNEHTLRSSIWKYDGERWQLFFHQGTKTTELN